MLLTEDPRESRKAHEPGRNGNAHARPAGEPGARSMFGLSATTAPTAAPVIAATPGQVARSMVGSSSGVTQLLDLIDRVAATDTTVLIRGESGVGKELVARELHSRSAHANRAFIVVDCASLHDNLLQSELFGHEKGAYTGAIRLKQGLFELAHHGTIFLDEIAELTPELQVKLLRVLETGTFRRLGGTADIKVEVRVIAATNRPLELLLREGRFREDLFYRLNVFPIDVPPLRERTDDVPLLAQHFIRTGSIASKRSTRLSPAALQALLQYPWPGNVRELANAIERALILCDGATIEPHHLPMHAAVAAANEAEKPGRLETLQEVEARHMAQVLAVCDGHRRRAADVLGISERSLYRMLKQSKLSPMD
jgi:transcriptional regulator with PAS, ATPase and Fis domain